MIDNDVCNNSGNCKYLIYSHSKKLSYVSSSFKLPSTTRDVSWKIWIGGEPGFETVDKKVLKLYTN